MQLVKVWDKEIRLNSMLDEYIFGKTKYDSVISQQGILFTCDSFENNHYHFKSQVFNFETVRSEFVPGFNSPLVFYCADNCGFSENSKTLLEFFENAGKENSTLEEKNLAFDASYAVISVLTQCALEKTALPAIGGGGILLELDGQNTKILFMPESLFKTSSAALQKSEEAVQNGYWINSTLYDLPAICFERSVIAYKALTGRFPFTATELDERNADILDKRFLPLELSVQGIDTNLSNEIDRALKLTSSAVNLPGKKQKGKASEDLTPVPEFPLDLFYQSKNLSNIFNDGTKNQTEEFAKKAADFEKKQHSRVNAKRTIRRNTTKIIISAVVAVILVIIAVNTRNSRMKEYTPTGLTSTQVIEGFMRGVNDKDTALLQNFSKGKSAEAIQKTVTQIYVIDKQRTTYDGDHGFPPPQEWLLYLTDESQWSHSSVYGVTGLMIDGEKGNLGIELKTSADKPEILTKEDGKTLENKAIKNHEVNYFVIHTEGEDNMIYVEYCSDIFTTTYKKDRWIITDISSHTEKIPVNTAEFLSDWFETFRNTENDAAKSAELLSIKYPWLPDSKDISRTKEFIESDAEQIFRAMKF